MGKQLKIEVGKSYKTRNGSKVIISEIDEACAYPMIGDILNEARFGTSWTKDGRHSVHIQSGADIVSEWEEEHVNHPSHYGGSDNPYEAIKVIEAWQLNFNLGNVIKYISRAGKKGSKTEDLQKALWYLQREVNKQEKE